MPTQLLPAIPSTDSAAIHSDELDQFSGLTEKTSPVDNDLLLLEDTEDSGSLKSVEVKNLPGVATLIKKRVQHSDINDAAASQTVSFASDIPAKAIVMATWFDLDTAFSGGGTGSAVVNIGDSDDDDGFVQAENIFTGATAGQHTFGIANTAARWAKGAQIWTHDTAVTPTIKITADTTVGAFTAGDLTAYVMYIVKPAGASVS